MPIYHHVTDYFNADGPFAKKSPHYRFRQAQLELAQAIEQTIQKNGTLVAEAGTGTGKTWAYLVPAFLSEGKVIISTGTKTLQDQLFNKDVAAVRQATKLPVQVALLKGRANYVCHYYLNRLEEEGKSLASKREAEDFQKIKRFAQSSATGDKTDCSSVNENAPIWMRVTSTQENCLGKDCPFLDECFVLKARKRAQEAEVVIVNHSLYMADYMLRQQKIYDLLPAADTVIFDEAHQLPDCATDFMGSMVSTHHVHEWLRAVQVDFSSLLKDVSQEWKSAPTQAQTALSELILACRFLEKTSSQRKVYTQIPELDKFLPVYKQFLQQILELVLILQKVQERHTDLGARAKEGAKLYESFLDWLPSSEQSPKNHPLGLDLSSEEAKAIIQTLAEKHDPLAEVQAADQPEATTSETGKESEVTPQVEIDYIRWLELNSTRQHIRFSKAPLSVQEFGRSKLPDQSWVFTSATISVNKQPDFFTKTLGLTKYTYKHWDSPFDYQDRALMYVLPRSAPLYTEEGYNSYLVDTVLKLLPYTWGGTLILCTSLRAVDEIAALLQQAKEEQLHHKTVFKQGDSPRAVLAEQFREDGKAILVASASFWEGVDFPGDVLTLLVIDKLPFAPPDDPVLEARIKACKERGGNPFMEFQIPHAAIALKQGVGRLIRTERDSGVLVIGDTRLVDKPYGKLLWKSLPEFARSRELEYAINFMQAQTKASA
ncbi:ATP-dependent DNA helicase [Brackiella oedipodis]|uniref:ATP-dependent DNA helicase n=1 Tax=Brackiella oedipodis TaxID=124225 RepID=UPI000571A65F|nr:ATP-dependent DNA helicase [Brackiella oedipodis]